MGARHTSATLLQFTTAQSFRDTVVWLADPFHFNVAAQLLESVRSGGPTVEHVTGKSVFEYFAGDRVEFDRFHLAMTNLSAMAVAAALEAYDFSCFNTIVDVGGGHGFAICSILQRYPHMQGILFDLRETVPGANKRIHELGLQERCRTAFGDFFQAVPEGGDVYFIQHILHDWSDEQALAILQNCRRALRIAAAHWRNNSGHNRTGKVVLLEFVLAARERTARFEGH